MDISDEGFYKESSVMLNAPIEMMSIKAFSKISDTES